MISFALPDYCRFEYSSIHLIHPLVLFLSHHLPESHQIIIILIFYLNRFYIITSIQSISIHNFKHSSSDKQSIHIYFIFHILTDQRRTILWKKSLYPTILTIPIVDNYVYKDGLLHKE